MALPSIATLALRGVPGAFILNSGVGKLDIDEDTATFLHGEAAKGVPALEELDPQLFGKLLAFGEIAVGSALLLPFIPNRIAGLALGGLSAGLLSVYFRDPEKTEADGIRPSGAGTALAKDSWMAAIALALVTAGGKKSKKSRKPKKTT
ncbi:hypothetical protein [Brevibacterium yomogidense]|uniref:hypothetical protein n=1 Tax=Brevibacterium yomogidense TaxID=946573 RepID=UPI0018DFD71B|nr:hypothetical protein [Brevibacterium yomogidense]